MIYDVSIAKARKCCSHKSCAGRIAHAELSSSLQYAELMLKLCNVKGAVNYFEVIRLSTYPQLKLCGAARCA